MTRFVYIADTHFGADPMGYQMQPGYADRLREIMAALVRWIRGDGRIDFVLHGGDMVDLATDANIAAAGELFALPAPVYLCLGNHDLTGRDAVVRWLAAGPRFFAGSAYRPAAASYSVRKGDCMLHVAPNHWNDRADYYWDDELTARLDADQVAAITAAAAEHADVLNIICTHSPTLAVPTEQTGCDQFHAPAGAFTDCMLDLARRTGARLILGAHSHANMHVERDGIHVVTVSALVETPMEFKLIEIDAPHLRMTTHSLADMLTFPMDYDPANAFVHGRTCDRQFDDGGEAEA